MCQMRCRFCRRRLTDPSTGSQIGATNQTKEWVCGACPSVTEELKTSASGSRAHTLALTDALLLVNQTCHGHRHPDQDQVLSRDSNAHTLTHPESLIDPQFWNRYPFLKPWQLSGAFGWVKSQPPSKASQHINMFLKPTQGDKGKNGLERGLDGLSVSIGLCRIASVQWYRGCRSYPFFHVSPTAMFHIRVCSAFRKVRY